MCNVSLTFCQTIIAFSNAPYLQPYGPEGAACCCSFPSGSRSTLFLLLLPLAASVASRADIVLFNSAALKIAETFTKRLQTSTYFLQHIAKTVRNLGRKFHMEQKQLTFNMSRNTWKIEITCFDHCFWKQTSLLRTFLKAGISSATVSKLALPNRAMTFWAELTVEMDSATATSKCFPWRWLDVAWSDQWFQLRFVRYQWIFCELHALMAFCV